MSLSSTLSRPLSKSLVRSLNGEIVAPAPPPLAGDLSNIRDGLLAFWPMEHDSLAAVSPTPDCGPYGYDMAMDGTTVGGRPSGFGRNVLDWDAGIPSIGIANYDALKRTGTFTISVWAKFDITGNISLATRWQYSGNFRSWSFKVVNDIPSFNVSSSGLTSINVSGTAVTQGVWHHYVAIYKASTYIRVYVDGVMTGEKTTGIYASTYASSIFYKAGIFAINENPMDGMMIDHGFWSRALTQDEIDGLYNNGTPVTCTSFPTLYLRAEDGTILTAEDGTPLEA